MTTGLSSFPPAQISSISQHWIKSIYLSTLKLLQACQGFFYLHSNSVKHQTFSIWKVYFLYYFPTNIWKNFWHAQGRIPILTTSPLRKNQGLSKLRKKLLLLFLSVSPLHRFYLLQPEHYSSFPDLGRLTFVACFLSHYSMKFTTYLKLRTQSKAHLQTSIADSVSNPS